MANAELKEKLILAQINARRKRYGVRPMLTITEITHENSVSYMWAKENVEAMLEVADMIEKPVKQED